MTVKGTLKYRKVERTPQVGKDAGKGDGSKGDNAGQGSGSTSSGGDSEE